MPLDFPTSPVLNQLYTFGGKTWKWDGAGWISYNIGLVGPYVISINGVTGAIGIISGSNVTITQSGNTFTISNLGMMDIEDFTAIINPPDSCILAVGRIKEIVVKKGEGFAVSNVMNVTLSCDHRSVDGAVGASFLQTLKGFIEQPVTMLV